MPSTKTCSECGRPRRVSATSASSIVCRDCRRKRQVQASAVGPAGAANASGAEFSAPSARPVGDLQRSLDAALDNAGGWIRDSDPATVALARTLAREIDEAAMRWNGLLVDLGAIVEAGADQLGVQESRTLLRLMRQIVDRDHPVAVHNALSSRYRDVLAELGLSPAARRRVDMTPMLPFGQRRPDDGVDEIAARMERKRREAGA